MAALRHPVPHAHAPLTLTVSHTVQHWVKEGATVIDIGCHRQSDGTLTGEVQFEEARARAAYITPVPGGVGPMTVAYVLHNTIVACERRHGIAPTE